MIAFEWKYLCIAAITVVPAQICIYAECILRLHFAPWKFTLLASCTHFANILCTLTLVIGFQLGVLGFILGVFISNVLVCPIALWLIRRELTLSFDTSFIKSIVSFAAPFILTSIAYWVFGSTLQILEN